MDINALSYYWDLMVDLYFGLGATTGGLMINLGLALVAIPTCFVLGLLVACLSGSRLMPLRVLSKLYIECAKSTPLILMIFWFYSLLPAFFGIDVGLIEGGFYAIVFIETAYMSEVFRSGLNSIEHRAIEIAKVNGLNRFSIIVYIIVPQVVIRMLPALIGVCISLFKDTSAIYIIGVVELTQTGSIIANRDPDSLIFIYIVTGLGYYVVCSLFSFVERIVSSRCVYQSVNGLQ
ncbi:amino acid ABC transporter permease [Photobacterium lutimaris]|uniref:ABC transmembrane type-1 domain-containing protein n=1 Tax=Photobacterium lutimaris TaxID=388278 RepID=A0A2T3J349_9GAMM|nr:amino acid ABC transporter permease [Photobacterium lutimaris]PSU35719.1 hypothetical protein C9I99_01490 [Photobacterium lutimaris]